MAKIRQYNFVVGSETNSAPVAGTPSNSSDLITLAYFQGYIKGGVETISNGAQSKVVTFSSAFGAATYGLGISIRNTVDGSPIFLNPIVTAKSASGFTVSFNAPTDTSDYVLDWTAVRYA